MLFLQHRERGASPLVILCVLALVLYLIYAQYFSSPSINANKEEKAAANLEQQNLIKDKEKVNTAVQEALVKQIIMKINIQRNTAWVDSQAWTNMTVVEKQKLITLLAKHFDYEGSLARVNLYDHQSGRKVGDYTLWSGLKFY